MSNDAKVKLFARSKYNSHGEIFIRVLSVWSLNDSDRPDRRFNKYCSIVNFPWILMGEIFYIDGARKTRVNMNAEQFRRSMGKKLICDSFQSGNVVEICSNGWSRRLFVHLFIGNLGNWGAKDSQSKCMSFKYMLRHFYSFLQAKS